MTDCIYKYSLMMHTHAEQVITMSRGAQILHVHWQGAICLWVRVTIPADVPVVLATRTFMIIGTGRDWPEGFSYIGTAHEPPFVWHVLEKDA